MSTNFVMWSVLICFLIMIMSSSSQKHGGEILIFPSKNQPGIIRTGDKKHKTLLIIPSADGGHGHGHQYQQHYQSRQYHQPQQQHVVNYHMQMPMPIMMHSMMGMGYNGMGMASYGMSDMYGGFK